MKTSSSVKHKYSALYMNAVYYLYYLHVSEETTAAGLTTSESLCLPLLRKFVRGSGTARKTNWVTRGVTLAREKAHL